MKRFLAIAVALLLASVPPASAAMAEDQYVAILYLIQQGDAANSAGANSEAIARYTSALSSLQQLQRANPTWETNVVSYRLNYLSKRIAALGATLPSPVPVPALPPAEPTARAQDTLSVLQAQLQQSQADNGLLQAKLREALAARPASVDPAQVARAEDHIRQLTKENDLLKLSLNDAQSRVGSVPNSKEVAQLRKDLDEANRKLAAESSRATALAREKGDLQDRLNRSVTSPKENGSNHDLQRRLDEANQKLAGQNAAAGQLLREKNALAARLTALESEAANASALRAENELLKRQVAGLKAALPAAQTLDRLAAAEAQIVALQSEREILRLERAALEGRVKQMMAAVKAPVPAPSIARAEDTKRIKQLEDERDTLQRQLAARKDPALAVKMDQSSQEIVALRARLNVYGAKAVPYTSEELALFRQAPPKLAATDQPAHRSYSIPKPPAGMGKLVVEAQRYFARGDYAQAEDCYQQVLRKDDKNVYTLANLAAIEIESGKLDEADKNLHKALVIAPDDGYTLQTIGYLKFRQAQYDEAFDFLSRAAQINPESPEIQNYLGVTLSHKGQRSAAESALRKAITLEPGYASAHNNLAVIYATQNPPYIALAKMHYQKALAAGHPKNLDLEKIFEQKSSLPGQ